MFFFLWLFRKNSYLCHIIIGKQYGYGWYTKHFRYVYANIVLIE